MDRMRLELKRVIKRRSFFQKTLKEMFQLKSIKSDRAHSSYRVEHIEKNKKESNSC